MKFQVYFAIFLLIAGAGFFVAMQWNSRKLYEKKMGAGKIKHWSAQLVYLIKNYESAHLPVILYLLLFLLCYVGGLVMLKGMLR